MNSCNCSPPTPACKGRPLLAWAAHCAEMFGDAVRPDCSRAGVVKTAPRVVYPTWFCEVPAPSTFNFTVAATCSPSCRQSALVSANCSKLLLVSTTAIAANRAPITTNSRLLATAGRSTPTFCSCGILPSQRWFVSHADWVGGVSCPCSCSKWHVLRIVASARCRWLSFYRWQPSC